MERAGRSFQMFDVAQSLTLEMRFARVCNPIGESLNLVLNFCCCKLAVKTESIVLQKFFLQLKLRFGAYLKKKNRMEKNSRQKNHFENGKEKEKNSSAKLYSRS